MSAYLTIVWNQRGKTKKYPPTHTFYWLVWCHDTWSIFLILDWNDIWSIYGFCVSLVPGLNLFKVSHVLTNLIWLRLSDHQLQLTDRWTVRVTPLRQNTWLVLDEVLCKSPATVPIKSNLYLPVPLSRVVTSFGVLGRIFGTNDLNYGTYHCLMSMKNEHFSHQIWCRAALAF